jgi:precorrin-2 dehydrogenase/sirohydrochlorin ferrochelatase
MLPLVLDLARLRLALIGEGEACLRRLKLLDEAGARALTVYSARPSRDLEALAGDRLVRRWPEDADLAPVHLIFIAGLDADARDAFARRAQQAGKIVHAEDAKLVTDIHAPAVLRRGDLVLAVSTSGKAPGLAVELRNFLGRLIGPEWRERLEEISGLRQGWIEAGISHDIIAARTGEWMRGWNWLPVIAAAELPEATETAIAPEKPGREKPGIAAKAPPVPA